MKFGMIRGTGRYMVGLNLWRKIDAVMKEVKGATPVEPNATHIKIFLHIN